MAIHSKILFERSWSHYEFSEISDQFSVGAERTRQIIGKGVRLLRETLQKSIKCFLLWKMEDKIRNQNMV